jgi:hypothetical protein
MAGRARGVDSQTWDQIADLAISNNLGPALWLAIRGQSPKSQETTDRLRSAYHVNLGVMIRVRHQLHEALAVFHEYGVSPVPIKGALYLLDGTFADLGERMLSDIDVLVEPDAIEVAVTALRSVGYTRVDKPFDRGHEVVMVHRRRPVPIELHFELGDDSLTTVLGISEVLSGASPTSGDAADEGWRTPSSTHIALHHVLHAQVQDRSWRAFAVPLRQLQTFHAVVRRHGNDIDWLEVGARLRYHGHGDAYESYLRLARFFFDTPLPPSESLSVGGALDAGRLHDSIALANLAIGNRPGNVYRNLSWALDGQYLRDRYSSSIVGDLPLAVLRAWHVAVLCRRGVPVFSDVTTDHW